MGLPSLSLGGFAAVAGGRRSRWRRQGGAVAERRPNLGAAGLERQAGRHASATPTLPDAPPQRTPRPRPPPQVLAFLPSLPRRPFPLPSTSPTPIPPSHPSLQATQYDDSPGRRRSPPVPPHAGVDHIPYLWHWTGGSAPGAGSTRPPRGGPPAAPLLPLVLLSAGTPADGAATTLLTALVRSLLPQAPLPTPPTVGRGRRRRHRRRCCRRRHRRHCCRSRRRPWRRLAVAAGVPVVGGGVPSLPCGRHHCR